MTKIEEVKLTYKSKTRALDRPKIKCAEDAYKIFLKSWDMDQIELLEEAKAMFLDRQMRMMSITSISKGGINGAVVDLRLVFAIALKRRATSIILAHNHPSGNLEASLCDIRLTKRFHEAGNIMDIQLNDHLIITKDGFNSILHCD